MPTEAQASLSCSKHFVVASFSEDSSAVLAATAVPRGEANETSKSPKAISDLESKDIALFLNLAWMARVRCCAVLCGALCSAICSAEPRPILPIMTLFRRFLFLGAARHSTSYEDAARLLCSQSSLTALRLCPLALSFSAKCSYEPSCHGVLCLDVRDWVS